MMSAMIKFLYGLIRPICPQCRGQGGFKNYYGDDWSGCHCCNPEEDNEDTITRVWRWRWWAYLHEMRQLDKWVDKQMRAEEAASSLTITTANDKRSAR